VIALNHTYVSCKANSPKSLIVVRTLCTRVHQQAVGFSSPVQAPPQTQYHSMSEVLSRAQPYIQLEEVMKTFFNHAAKHGDEESLKSSYEASVNSQDKNRGQPAFKRQALYPSTKSAPNLQSDGITFHSVEAPHQRGPQYLRGCRLGARDQSGTIPLFREQKNIAPTMSIRDTRPSTIGPSENT